LNIAQSYTFSPTTVQNSNYSPNLGLAVGVVAPEKAYATTGSGTYVSGTVTVTT
jgi:hypothetical protein